MTERELTEPRIIVMEVSVFIGWGFWGLTLMISGGYKLRQQTGTNMIAVDYTPPFSVGGGGGV